MALRAGYYGLKKKLIEKVTGLPAIKSIGSGLSLNASTGELSTTGGGGTTVVANPEGTATEDLTKLKVGETIYGVEGDTSKCYKTTDDTESAIVDADYIPFLDSSAASGAGAPKKSTWSNVKSKLKAYFDGLYNNYLEQTVTLGTSDTTVIFTDAAILANSVISVYAGRSGGDVSGSQNTFPYKSIYTTAGSCTIVFPSLASSVSAKVRINIL